MKIHKQEFTYRNMNIVALAELVMLDHTNLTLNVETLFNNSYFERVLEAKPLKALRVYVTFDNGIMKYNFWDEPNVLSFMVSLVMKKEMFDSVEDFQRFIKTEIPLIISKNKEALVSY